MRCCENCNSEYKEDKATMPTLILDTKTIEVNISWRFVTGTLRWLASLHCLLYFLAFDWLRPAFLKLDSLPFCKGKSYLKLSKLILDWTVRKN